MENVVFVLLAVGGVLSGVGHILAGLGIRRLRARLGDDRDILSSHNERLKKCEKKLGVEKW